MKTIKEIRKEYKCPKCKKKDELAFNAENVYCYRCNKSFDLGMHKWN